MSSSQVGVSILSNGVIEVNHPDKGKIQVGRIDLATFENPYGLEEAGKSATVFHAGTKRQEDGSIVTAGGRVLGVTALGADLNEAISNAYAACAPISFQDMHMRKDIGKV